MLIITKGKNEGKKDTLIESFTPHTYKSEAFDFLQYFCQRKKTMNNMYDHPL